jgi:hypothetical protein
MPGVNLILVWIKMTFQVGFAKLLRRDLQTIGHEFNSFRLLLQLGLIALAP